MTTIYIDPADLSQWLKYVVVAMLSGSFAIIIWSWVGHVWARRKRNETIEFLQVRGLDKWK